MWRLMRALRKRVPIVCCTVLRFPGLKFCIPLSPERWLIMAKTVKDRANDDEYGIERIFRRLLWNIQIPGIYAVDNLLLNRPVLEAMCGKRFQEDRRA